MRPIAPPLELEGLLNQLRLIRQQAIFESPSPWGVTQLHGGMNNQAYLYNNGIEAICIKLYLVDERHRAEREWEALCFLQEHKKAIAPKPLWYSAHENAPAIGMTMTPGISLIKCEANHNLLAEFAEVLSTLFSISPSHNNCFPWSRVSPAQECITRVEKWGNELLATNKFSSTLETCLIDRIRSLVEYWLTSDDRRLLTESPLIVFGRGDPNLENCLWDGERVRLIDFEYAGWSDLAFELGDLIEHVKSRVWSDAVWNHFLSHFMPNDDRFHERFNAARRTCALLMIILMMRRQLQRTREFEAQLQRTERLYL